MNKNVIIIGAGGFGREVAWYISDIIASGADWKFAGYLDDDADATVTASHRGPILSRIMDYQIQDNDRFVCAIGDPMTKLSICRALLERGAQFVNLIHPTATVSEHCCLGTGVIFCPNSGASPDVEIGDFVTFNGYSSVGHDAKIADGCTLGPYASVTGYAKVGEAVSLGSHAVITPGMTVGEHAKIGSGSVVLGRVKPGQTAFGVPAKCFAMPGKSD